MNTVILTSVLSAGNHAIFAGTREQAYFTYFTRYLGCAEMFNLWYLTTGILYGLSSSQPRLAPRLFSKTTKQGVPLPALLATSSISALCFASSFVGTGVLWGWLQNIVGVSNQVLSYI